MYFPDQILLGTVNKDKICEFREFLEPHFKTVISLPELTQTFEEPIESGKTFYENAQIKANHYCLKTGIPTLSDDSGLSIPALNNWPGIYTKRFGKQFETLAQCYADIENRLHGLSHEAFFSCALVLRFVQGYSVMASGKISGHLTFPGRGTGFDADPIFIPKGELETYAENPNLKKRDSHRKIALQNLLASLHS